MEIFKKKYAKYLIVALIVVILVYAIMLAPVITSDMPKKWVYFGITGIIAGLAVTGLLFLCDFLHGRQDISKYMGGSKPSPTIAGYGPQIREVNDLFG